MKHGVAVRTDRNQVSLWVHGVAGSNFAERMDMMDMDEAVTDLAVGCTKVETTHSAHCAEVSDTGTPRVCIALVSVDGDASHRTLPKTLRRRNLVGENDRSVTALDEEGTPTLFKFGGSVGSDGDTTSLRVPMDRGESTGIEAGTRKNRLAFGMEKNVEASRDVERRSSCICEVIRSEWLV